jgi:RNA polymerase sigma-70 factor, ECF subfamily
VPLDASPSYVALLRELASRVESLYSDSSAAAWQLTRVQFLAGLERSVAKRFADTPIDRDRLEEYLLSLHIDDLVLATACMQGSEPAWEHFVSTYRGYLRAAAGVITKGSRSGTDAEELADSVFAELFGLADGKRGEASLFRYFHGRSSLKTWLRTILAQRHIDCIRRTRRFESLEHEDGAELKPLPAEMVAKPEVDPHRADYLRCFQLALTECLDSLDVVDRQRLELYYARQKTLAEIGRALGEHESSVSRNLERIRRELRAKVEECLRAGMAGDNSPGGGLSPMSDAEVRLCFQYAAEEAPIDFRQMFSEPSGSRTAPARKESP